MRATAAAAKCVSTDLEFKNPNPDFKNPQIPMATCASATTAATFFADDDELGKQSQQRRIGGDIKSDNPMPSPIPILSVDALAWELAAIASKLLHGSAVYKAPFAEGQGAAFLVLKNVRWCTSSSACGPPSPSRSPLRHGHVPLRLPSFSAGTSSSSSEGSEKNAIVGSNTSITSTDLVPVIVQEGGRDDLLFSTIFERQQQQQQGTNSNLIGLQSSRSDGGNPLIPSHSQQSSMGTNAPKSSNLWKSHSAASCFSRTSRNDRKVLKANEVGFNAACSSEISSEISFAERVMAHFGKSYSTNNILQEPTRSAPARCKNPHVPHLQEPHRNPHVPQPHVAKSYSDCYGSQKRIAEAVKKAYCQDNDSSNPNPANESQSSQRQFLDLKLKYYYGDYAVSSSSGSNSNNCSSSNSSCTGTCLASPRSSCSSNNNTVQEEQQLQQNENPIMREEEDEEQQPKNPVAIVCIVRENEARQHETNPVDDAADDKTSKPQCEQNVETEEEKAPKPKERESSEESSEFNYPPSPRRIPDLDFFKSPVHDKAKGLKKMDGSPQVVNGLPQIVNDSFRALYAEEPVAGVGEADKRRAQKRVDLAQKRVDAWLAAVAEAEKRINMTSRRMSSQKDDTDDQSIDGSTSRYYEKYEKHQQFQKAAKELFLEAMVAMGDDGLHDE